MQFFANHDDSKLLVELYVRPEEAWVAASADSFGRRRTQDTIADAQDAAGLGCAAWQFSARTRRGCRLRYLAGGGRNPPARAAYLDAFGEPQTIGEDSFVYRAAGQDYRVSGGSFFQTNRFLIDKLVEVVVGTRTGRAALDLYAGAGLFTTHLARNFDQVIAVEASPHSFADLRHNVPHNVKCLSITTETFLAERAAKLAPDLVVLDPPRAGLGEKAAKALCGMSASRVTYVSCDPATLSRDLRVLLESGYRVEQVHLVDMFPQTYHMETVLHLAR